jgi:hypothetical protein
LARRCAEHGFDLLLAADEPAIRAAAEECRGDRHLPDARRHRGQGDKDDRGAVARVGFEAMMRGDGNIVSGWGNKVQAAMANVTPATVLAQQDRKKAAPPAGPDAV